MRSTFLYVALALAACGGGSSGGSPDARGGADAPTSTADARPGNADAGSVADAPGSADGAPSSVDAPPPLPDARAAAITLDPPSHDFGATVLLDQVTFTFTVENTGDVTSAALAVTVDGDGFALGAFTSECASAPLGAHETCKILVVFSPQAAGAATGTLHVTAGAQPLTATLAGEGVTAGALSAAPKEIPFPALVIHASSSSQTVTVTNTGQTATGSIAVALTGSGVASFTFSDDECTGITLAAAATCTFTVVFAPMVRGDIAASVSISAAPGGTATVAVSGAGQAQALLASDANHDFGLVPVGQKRSFGFTVSNTGDVATGTLIVNMTGGLGSFDLASDCGTTPLAGGASCTITVTFQPVRPGMTGSTVHVSAAPGGAISLVSTGTGVPGTATLTVPPDARAVVTSDPAGIDCGTTCAAAFPTGSDVSLSAKLASEHMTVVGWIGDCDGISTCAAADPTCTVTMTRSCFAAPIIGPIDGNLVLFRSGTGSVKSRPDGIDCKGPTETASPCFIASAPFDPGPVTLTPYGRDSDATSFRNVAWSGCTTVQEDKSCDLDITTDGAAVAYSCQTSCFFNGTFNMGAKVDTGCGIVEPCFLPPSP